MNTVLHLENVLKTFHEKTAVNRVSFSVQKGEVFGFLGPNGAGKTTTIRMIMGIIAPDEGNISFDFEGLGSFKITNPRIKKLIGYLPEERGIYSTGRVLETILYFAELKNADLKQAKKDALNWLKRLGLEEYRDRKVEELSKGMQQKIQFIISIIHRPRLIILDELFSGLDPVNQELFKDFILELKEQGTTILLSSHRMNLVEELCDRIFLINRGRKVLYGKLEEIKENFGVERVWLRYRGDLQFKPQWPGIKNVKQKRGELSFDLGKGTRPSDILPELLSSTDIQEIKVTRLPLHDIFIATVGGEQR